MRGRFLAVIATLAVSTAGCTGGMAPEETTTAPTQAPQPTPTPTMPTSPGRTTSVPPAPTTTTPTALPALEPWSAGPGEVLPAVKELATGAVEAAGTWEDGANGVEDLQSRLTGLGIPAALGEAASTLLDGDAAAASVDVIYPQYAGLTEDRASVMVVAEHHLAVGDTVAVRGVTVDVRLIEEPDGWAVEAILPAEAPAPAADLPAAARGVLDNPRIRLTEVARADIAAGIVDPLVLGVLDELAQDHVLDVVVVVSGHPPNVFGQAKLSNHVKGRAVDIWAIDNQPIVDPDTPRELVEQVLLTAEAHRADEIGSPYDLDGSGPDTRVFFTNDVHQDHVHVGFEPAESAPPRRPQP